MTMFGDKKSDCPFWRGPCREHACRLYVQIQGANPNTGEQVNKYDCSFAWLPFLLIENSQQQRQTGAAVESFRNEMVVANRAMSDVVRDASQLNHHAQPILRSPCADEQDAP